MNVNVFLFIVKSRYIIIIHALFYTLNTNVLVFLDLFLFPVLFHHHALLLLVEEFLPSARLFDLPPQGFFRGSVLTQSFLALDAFLVYEPPVLSSYPVLPVYISLYHQNIFHLEVFAQIRVLCCVAIFPGNMAEVLALFYDLYIRVLYYLYILCA